MGSFINGVEIKRSMGQMRGVPAEAASFFQELSSDLEV